MQEYRFLENKDTDRFHMKIFDSKARENRIFIQIMYT